MDRLRPHAKARTPRKVYLRFVAACCFLCFAACSHAQQVQLPDAPLPVADTGAVSAPAPDSAGESASASVAWSPSWIFSPDPADPGPADGGDPDGDSGQTAPHAQPGPDGPVDDSGNAIPLNRLQPKRILGIMPNFRSVSGGSKPHPPGWKYNFTVATRQATDYSSFFFLGLTSLSAEAINAHPVLGKGADGFYAYAWRGFLDKTDGTYESAWLLPSLLHEDTRFYALGTGHSILIRSLYVISRQGVARTYGGRQTPNIAGLGGKVLTQIVSRTYYPPGATSFGVLATKFGYSAMRDIAFTSIREFYPDIAAHYIKKHREKAARLAGKDAATQ
jgi:hypothetical protein